MNPFARSMTVFAIAGSLVACGGQKIGGGKEGAAAALFGASSLSAQGTNRQGLTQGLTSAGTVSVPCQKGGTAELKYNMAFPDDVTLGGALNSQSKFNILYKQCAQLTYDNPKTTNIETDKVVLDGSMDFVQTLDIKEGANTAAASIEQKMKGKINYGGAFNDYIDADVTQTVSVTAASSQSGSVSIILNGTIKTSDDSYTYNNETISFTAGMLIAE